MGWVGSDALLSSSPSLIWLSWGFCLAWAVTISWFGAAFTYMRSSDTYGSSDHFYGSCGHLGAAATYMGTEQQLILEQQPGPHYAAKLKKSGNNSFVAKGGVLEQHVIK